MPGWLSEIVDRFKRVGFVVGFLSLFAASVVAFAPQYRGWAYLIAVLIVLAIVFSTEVQKLTSISIGLIRVLAPVVVLGVFFVVVEIRMAIGRVENKLVEPHPPMQIEIRQFPLAGLYNSTADYQLEMVKDLPAHDVPRPQPGYTHVFTNGEQGNDWVISLGGGSGKEASFSFDRHEDGLKAVWASSGGYVSFPGAPINRLVYRYLTFDCKATAFEGQPDIGVRLVLNDPRSGGTPWGKEAEVYELKSLNQQPISKPLSITWQKYELDTRDFDPSPAVLPDTPNAVDSNLINKIVFFLNDQMTRGSAKGTIWIRNVVFSASK